LPPVSRGLTVRVTAQQSGGLVFDSKRNLVYSLSPTSNSVVAVDPGSGQTIRTLGFKFAPFSFSITDDCEYLYATAGAYITRLNLATNGIDETFASLNVPTSELSMVGVEQICAEPGDPNSVAAGVSDSIGTMEPYYEIGFYSGDSSGPSSTVGIGGPFLRSLVFGTSGALYGLMAGNYLAPFGAVAADKNRSTSPSTISLGNPPFQLSGVGVPGKLIVGGIVYSDPGLQQLGHFGTTGSAWLVAPIPNSNRAYGLCPSQPGQTKAIFAKLNLDTYAIEQTWPGTSLPNQDGNFISSFIYVGENRVACVVTNKQDTQSNLVFITFPASSQ